MTTSELDRLVAAREQSQALGEFLEWLVSPVEANGGGGTLVFAVKGTTEERCTYRGGGPRGGRGDHCVDGEIHDNDGFTCTYCWHCQATGWRVQEKFETFDPDEGNHIEAVLAEYLGIDLVRVEQERNQILRSLP